MPRRGSGVEAGAFAVDLSHRLDRRFDLIGLGSEFDSHRGKCLPAFPSDAAERKVRAAPRLFAPMLRSRTEEPWIELLQLLHRIGEVERHQAEAGREMLQLRDTGPVGVVTGL